MSAFMCSKEHIWDIALYFADYYPYKWEKLLMKRPTVSDIYKKLTELNVRSLCERYGEHAVVPELTGPLSELYSYEGCSDQQELDNLCIEMSSYLYQSCKGNCYKDPVFELTERLYFISVAYALFNKLDDETIRKYWR